MKNEQEPYTTNDIQDYEQKNTMNIITKLLRTLMRLFTLESLAFVITLVIGAYTLLSKYFPEYNYLIILSVTISFLILYGVKFFQYYGD